MGHPWYEDTIAVVRKQPNVYAEISALYYRPWQFWNIMITAQEYLITDKIFFGTDFPFSTVEDSLAGIRAVNEVVQDTRLPRVSAEMIEAIIHANPFAHWWHGPAPV
jgi:predicted TIM-barrel fold metal-dependent hydrolase